MNFHRQLHSQFESSTPAKKKIIIEDPTGVGPGGEAPMLKLANNFYISQIERRSKFTIRKSIYIIRVKNHLEVCVVGDFEHSICQTEPPP